MWRWSWVLLFSLILACGDDAPPLTEIRLRLQATDWVRSSGQTLKITVTRLHDGQWLAKSQVQRDFSELPEWPFDVPIQPKEKEAGDDPIEVVATVFGSQGEALAESRAITRFVTGRQLVLELVIQRCPGAGVCENPAECHGDACLTCLAGECVPTPERTNLPDYDRNAPATQIDGGNDAPEAAAHGDSGAEMDGHVDGEPDGGDEGAFGDGGADTSTPPECVEAGEKRCHQNTVQTCTEGKWQETDSCEHKTCQNSECVGSCAPEERRCVGLFEATAETCENGQWAVDVAQGTDGVCEFACSAGLCTDTCASEGAQTCSPIEPNRTLKCQSGHWTSGDYCAQFCRQGSGCVVSPSCNVPTACAAGESCCSSPFVPGGTFFRSVDRDEEEAAPDAFPATVSPFHLDRFEVTVGRFKRWLFAYDAPGGKPAEGSGRTRDPDDMGWDPAWNAYLAADAAALKAQVTQDWCEPTFAEADNADLLPINCIDWYTAFAFCVWDGGRLPTDAEWNFAAVGGEQQRSYPWTEPGAASYLDETLASYAEAPIVAVGSYQNGKGRWGQLDLMGNILEWTRDAFSQPYAESSCSDCVNLTNDGSASARGGASGFADYKATPSYRHNKARTLQIREGGFRCIK